MPDDQEDSTTVTGPNTGGGAPTTPELPAVDDEATRVDPAEPKKARTAPGERSRGGARAARDDDDDDEATKHTGTPKKAREAQKLLEDSRRLNAAGGPKPPAKKLHPLVPLGVALAVLAMLLLGLNALVRPSVNPQTGESEPSALGRLFDW